MTDKVYKYKVVSWIVGILGGFALITGIGALIATVAYFESGLQLIRPIIQIGFAALITVGSILMYNNRILGKKVIIVSVVILLGLVVVDSGLYFTDAGDYMSVLSSLFLQVIPLVILLVVLKNISLDSQQQ